MGITTTARGVWSTPPNSIDNYWRYGNVGTILAALTNNQAWTTANQIIYVPLPVCQRVKVVKLWYAGSATASTGNVDMGIYDSDGVLVPSSSVGLTAKTGDTGDERVFNITDVTIGPGLYYVALLNTTTTDTFFAMTSAAPVVASIGVRTQTNATLPSTATWTVPQTLGFVPFVGMFLEGTTA